MGSETQQDPAVLEHMIILPRMQHICKTNIDISKHDRPGGLLLPAILFLQAKIVSLVLMRYQEVTLKEMKHLAEVRAMSNSTFNSSNIMRLT